MKMTKIENTSQTSTIVSKETDNISKNSFLHQYYVNIMENTEQSSVKIERAVKFLLLPEISKLTDDHTKAMFLLSKGLTHDEVLEAFEQYYKKQKRKLTPSVPELVLHNVNQVESNPQNTIQVRHASSSQSGLSIFLNLCQRMIFLAGISTAVYYLYQKWCTSRATDDDNKKERQRIEEELNHIKSELQKISADLKAQQAAGKTSASILSEINSLKAILVSRQYFEEKQNAKLSLPSWQLNSTASASSSIKNEKNDANTLDKKSIVASTISIESTPTNSTSSEQNILPIEEITPNKNDKAEPQINGNVELAKDSVSSSKQNIQSEEKITSPSKENNDVKQLENGVCEEKAITNGEYISDTPQKPKKNGTKSRPSKSKITENGNKNTHKQNGVAKVDVN